MSITFNKEQRVNVPGSDAQGVVIDAVESIDGFPVYTLRWLTSAGETMTGSCGEGDLQNANLAQWTVVARAADHVATLSDAVRRITANRKKTKKKKATRKRKR